MMSVDAKIAISNCCIVDDGFLWLFSEGTKALMKVSISSGEICDYYFVPERSQKELFYRMIKCAEHIFLIPFNSTEMWAFSLCSSEWKRVDIGLDLREKQLKSKFYSAVAFDNKIYMFGWSIPGIIVYDCISERYHRITDFLEYINDRRIIFHKAMCVDEEKIYLPVFLSTHIICFDLRLQKSSVIEMPIIAGKDCPVIEVDFPIIKLYSIDGKEYGIDEDGRQYEKEISCFSVGRRREPLLIDYYGETKFLIPEAFAMIVIANNTNKDMIELDYASSGVYPDGEMSKFTFAEKTEDKIFFQSRTDGRIYIFDKLKRNIQEITMNICDGGKEKLYKSIRNSININEIVDEREMSLESFIMIISKEGDNDES